MNMGSKYEAKSTHEKVVIGLSTDISKGFRKFFEKRGIDVDSDEFNNPVKQKVSTEPLDDRRSHMKAVAYGRSIRKRYGKKRNREP